MSTQADQKRAPLMGMNLELRRAGRAFHIQTEDLGLPRGELVTQLFISGTIVETVRHRYTNPDELSSRLPPTEAQLRHQMRDQHLSLVRAVQAGRYDLSARPTGVAPLTRSARQADPFKGPPHPTPAPPSPLAVPPPHQAIKSPALSTHQREVSSVQRGTSSLGRDELLPELLCLPQRPYPELKAQLLELKTRARQVLDPHAQLEVASDPPHSNGSEP